MKYPLIVWSLLIIFVTPQVSAQSLFDRIKKKADEIIAEQEAKADQKIDQKIDETVDSAEKAVYEGGETTTASTGTGAGTSQTAVTGDNGNPMLVKMTQTELKRLGYSVSVDGVYGTGTRNAILAYEADNGRQLTGNVSPDLINALKGTTTTNTASTPVQTAAGTQTQYTNQSVSSNAGAKGQGQMQQFFNDCKAAKPPTQQTQRCVMYCTNAAKFETLGHEVPEKSRNSCVSLHKAAMEGLAFSTDNQSTIESNAKEMRMLTAECQSIFENNAANIHVQSYSKLCLSKCRQGAERAAQWTNFSDEAMVTTERDIQACRERHELAKSSL